MSEQPILRGEHVDLRPLTRDDAALTLAWRQSARARLLNAGAQTVEEQAAWIASRPSSEYNYLIALKDGRPVGMLSLIGIHPVNRHAETARFLIGDEAAVHGIPAAVEAMKLLYALAFDTLGLHRIHGTVSEDNALMVKWQKYLGMKEEGRMRGHYFLDGRFQDAIVLGMLADEYRTQALPRMTAMIKMAARRPADARSN
jgi:RimJ/RimL family protein N-acetyltransferase